jgi:hypothetical protein
VFTNYVRLSCRRGTVDACCGGSAPFGVGRVEKRLDDCGFRGRPCLPERVGIRNSAPAKARLAAIYPRIGRAEAAGRLAAARGLKKTTPKTRITLSTMV